MFYLFLLLFSSRSFKEGFKKCFRCCPCFKKKSEPEVVEVAPSGQTESTSAPSVNCEQDAIQFQNLFVKNV